MRVAVVLYDFIEPIELAAVGTLSMATRLSDKLSYFTVSPTKDLLTLQNGLRVQADFSFNDAPESDVVIVTGGPGWKRQAENARMLDFLRQRHAAGACIASVCTGALLLAAAGLLTGKRATTKMPVTGAEQCPLETMRETYPDVKATPALVVDEGNVVTGGGVTLGIDLTLYLLGRFLGEPIARETARIMEYSASSAANRARLPTIVGKTALAA
jgi:transcriptional regulator GlxA family with amidase domain